MPKKAHPRAGAPAQTGQQLSFPVLIFLGCAISLLLRFSVALYPHSGMSTPPMYGDYEAQRHWMEITVNINISEWYSATPENDLQYWGLDYPPLTAYHSWLCGKITQFLEPNGVALLSSRGYETKSHKLIMRSFVVLIDCLIWFPAVALFVAHFYSQKNGWEKFLAFMFIANQPALLLIDHGHFQFNSFSLGLALWATVFLLQGRDFLASIAFSLSLNYKQMSLFYAPAFFAYLLGKNLNIRQPMRSLFTITSIGGVVLGVFALCWAPFLLSGGPTALQVVQRIFPVGRGLFEDKVANFWCSVSPILRMKEWFAVETLVRLCAGTTLLALVPSAVWTGINPTIENFIATLATCAYSFFMFGFQVHEKSILLPLLPVSLLILKRPNLAVWQHIISCFSMYPLLVRDGLAVPYAVLCIGVGTFASFYFSDFKSTRFQVLYAVLALIQAIFAFAVPPARYPDILTLLLTTFSFINFGLAFLTLHIDLFSKYVHKLSSKN